MVINSSFFSELQYSITLDASLKSQHSITQPLGINLYIDLSPE